jgi:hypothetical protein
MESYAVPQIGQAGTGTWESEVKSSRRMFYFPELQGFHSNNSYPASFLNLSEGIKMV